MLRRQNRLSEKIRFGNSSFFSTPQFILKTKKNGLLLNRFAIVVSKKIDKRAVVRNSFKRIFRSAIVDLIKDMNNGYDMLFIVKPGIKNLTKEGVKELIANSLKKSGYIKE